MADKNIVILGANYAGVNAAHYILRHVVPALPDSANFRVILVNPSKDIFHRSAAPRALLSAQLLPEYKVFWSIADVFKQYGNKHFRFVQGRATAIDEATRSVRVQLSAGQTQDVVYHALIVATGAHSADPVLSGQPNGDGNEVHNALAEIRTQIKAARHIVIGGGGPAGVECAGEIGEFLNGKPGIFSTPSPKAKIQLYTGADKLLPLLRKSYASQAADTLKTLGVEVVYNARIQGSERLDNGTTRVTLEDGTTIDADVYINAVGVKPTTDYLPPAWLTPKLQVNANPTTLRVDVAGPRVYVVGDAGSHTRGGIMDLVESIPVLGTNLKLDLLAADGVKPTVQDRQFKTMTGETQFVTLGRSKGIAAFNGFKIPSVVVTMVKGKDYLYSRVNAQFDGSHWKNEVKFKAVPLRG